MNEPLKLIVGHVYRAKHPRGIGFHEPLTNDRMIVWMDSFEREVQYDSPSVAFGRKFPKISVDTFRAWASRDVTAEMTDGEWMPHP